MNIQYLGTIKGRELNVNYFENKAIYRRIKYVVSENQRVLDAKKNLKESNIKEFSFLMNKSHESYSQDFEASNPDVNIIVKRSLKSGASGCRLTSGRFDGFTVSLIEKKNMIIGIKKC